MTDSRPEPSLASRWLREADEELRAAEVVAAHDELPDRVAGFHAHLAAEKALKAVLILVGVEVTRRAGAGNNLLLRGSATLASSGPATARVNT